MKIKAIYDNFGKTFDKYTVYYNYKENLGRHNGKHIKFEDLPKDCQKVINSDLMGV